VCSLHQRATGEDPSKHDSIYAATAAGITYLPGKIAAASKRTNRLPIRIRKSTVELGGRESGLREDRVNSVLSCFCALRSALTSYAPAR